MNKKRDSKVTKSDLETWKEYIKNPNDISDKDIEDFVDQLSSEQFEQIINFFTTAPKLRHVVEVLNPKTKVKGEVLLEGLQSFLE